MVVSSGEKNRGICLGKAKPETPDTAEDPNLPSLPMSPAVASGERRNRPRRVVGSLVRVNLGPEAGGFLSDLSEDGLAIALFGGTVRDQVVRLGFALPDTGYPIEALGQISWRDELARRAGVKFVDIPAASRQRIRDWILAHEGSKADTATRPEAKEARQIGGLTTQGKREAIFTSDELLADLRAAFAQAKTWPEPKPSKQAVGWSGILRGLPPIRLTRGLIAVLGTVSILGFLLVYPHSLVRTTPATNKEPAPASKDLEASAAVRPATSKNKLPTDIPLIPRGAILLQVAALPGEQEALALAETLQQRQFPAFVRIHRADHYYRVQVGPYADTESARLAKRRLEKDGFKAIIKR
ncbi:MAG TPA: SPOR domain-containing protein [Candidatus Acidoferrales bacterium]|nr:SPOR domain-containing protein [Candidatus Acidoferrales bacterium]